MIDILDVSQAQGEIDWQRVAAAKVAPGVDRHWRGVIAKCTEGKTYKDPKYLSYVKGARSVGMRFGLYHFLHPFDELESAMDGERLGVRIWNAAGDTAPHFRVVIDLESADKRLTPQQLLDRTLWARDGIAKCFGRFPGLYTYPDFYTRRMLSAFAKCREVAETMFLHWASYGAGVPWYPRAEDIPRAPEPWRTYGKGITLWQYSGNTKKKAGAWTGHVDGIAWDVDRNLFLGDEAAFTDFCGLTGAKGEAEAPIVRPGIEFEPRRYDS